MQASDISNEALAELEALMRRTAQVFRDAAAEMLRPQYLDFSRKPAAVPGLTPKI